MHPWRMGLDGQLVPRVECIGETFDRVDLCVAVIAKLLAAFDCI